MNLLKFVAQIVLVEVVNVVAETVIETVSDVIDNF